MREPPPTRDRGGCANDRKTRSGEGEKGTVTRIQREAKGTGTSEEGERERVRAGESRARSRREEVMDFIRPLGGRPSIFFSPFLSPLSLFRPLYPAGVLRSHRPPSRSPSLIVFHSFLRPFHFVTVRVPGRPCETFAVPHGWAG